MKFTGLETCCFLLSMLCSCCLEDNMKWLQSERVYTVEGTQTRSQPIKPEPSQCFSLTKETNLSITEWFQDKVSGYVQPVLTAHHTC